VDEPVPAQTIYSEEVGIATWIHTAVLMLSVSLLSLSVFAGPLLSAGDLVIILGVAAAMFYATSTNGITADRVGDRRLALFLAVLLNVHLISLTNSGAGQVLYGKSLMQAGNVMALVLLALWVTRRVLLKSFRVVHSPLDVAVMLLLLLTAACFLGLYLLLRLNGVPWPFRPGVLWVVMLSVLLYYCLRDVLPTEAATKRTLQLLLLPMGAACVAWVIATGLRW
jgi:hypothetical protein